MVVVAKTGVGDDRVCVYIDAFRMDVVVCSTDTSKPVFRVSADHQTHARRALTGINRIYYKSRNWNLIGDHGRLVRFGVIIISRVSGPHRSRRRTEGGHTGQSMYRYIDGKKQPNVKRTKKTGEFLFFLFFD